MQCPTCGRDMKEVKDKGADGWIWSCRRNIGPESHQKKVSIRQGSFMSGLRTDIQSILYALYEWSANKSVKQTAYELGLGVKCVRLLFRHFRNITSTVVLLRLSGHLGTDGETIEID